MMEGEFQPVRSEGFPVRASGDLRPPITARTGDGGGGGPAIALPRGQKKGSPEAPFFLGANSTRLEDEL
jgi:hypothetical protein